MNFGLSTKVDIYASEFIKKILWYMYTDDQR
jgi:hypothetical protein